MRPHAPGDGPSVADRMFTVLETCAASSEPLSLTEVAQRTGMPKSTLHRVCWGLVEHGMLEHGDGGFRIGTRLFVLGSRNPGLRRLRSLAMPYLQALVARSGWVVNLAIRADRHALIVEEVFGGHPKSVAHMGGERMPLHATAIGKALLSGLEPGELDALVGARLLPAFTRRTIVRPDVLRGSVLRTRATGVAYSHEEFRMGTSGVASPVVAGGRVVAAVAVVGVPDATMLRGLAQPVRRAAGDLGAALESPREAMQGQAATALS
jgi:DNA-binding IclR family transcriptional regulator